MENEKQTYWEIQNAYLIPALDRIAESRGELAALAKRLESSLKLKNAKIRISELRSGKRLLSFYYLKIMIDGGVMSITQIMRGRTIDELSETERDIVLRLMADPEILRLIYEAEKSGVDIKQLLSNIRKAS